MPLTTAIVGGVSWSLIASSLTSHPKAMNSQESERLCLKEESEPKSVDTHDNLLGPPYVCE